MTMRADPFTIAQGQYPASVRLGPKMNRRLILGSAGLLLALATNVAAANGPTNHNAPVTACRPGTIRQIKRIALGLQTKRVSTQGNCGSSIAIIGGTSRDIWGGNYNIWAGNYNNGLWHSTDQLRTWRLVWQGPAGSHVERALRTSSRAVLIEVVDSNGAHRIMRSATRVAHRFKTTFNLPTGSFLHFSTSWGQYSAVGGSRRTIYAAEYGDHPDPVHLWASHNDGRSFSTILSLRGRTSGVADRIRHFHGVFLDPYSHKLWVAIGDNTPEPRIGYSNDGGRSFTWVTQGTYPQSRAVSLMFAKDAVYWGTDVPERAGTLYRWDRSTGDITSVITGLREPFFDARQSKGWFVQLSQVSTKNDDYIGDDYVHVLVGHGSSWRHVRTPWRRNSVHKQEHVSPWGVTSPDVSGCFWTSLPYLAKSNVIKNIQLCLGR